MPTAPLTNPVRGPEVLPQNKIPHQSYHLSGPIYLFLSSALCVPGTFSKIKKEILQCHVGVIRKWALSLWYVILGQKLVIWPIVIMTFGKKTPWKFAGSAVTLPEICPHHYWIARSLTKNVFSFKQHLSAGTWWLPQGVTAMRNSHLIMSIMQYENRLYF